MNFDDIDFSKLSDTEREELLQLWRDDRYAFYSHWENPANVQKQMIQWARETDPSYSEKPVDKVFEIIGTLKAAGAPQGVLDYYKARFVAPDKFVNAPTNAKYEKVVRVYEKLYDELNWDEDPLPEYSDKNLDSPLHQKWLDIVDGVYFLMLDQVKHRLPMRHYRVPKSCDEVIELCPNNDEFLATTESFEELTPDLIQSSIEDGKLVVRLTFFMCYNPT